MTDSRPNRLRDYLNHMIQAIEQINVYLADVSEVEFLRAYPGRSSQLWRRRFAFGTRRGDAAWRATARSRNAVPDVKRPAATT